MTHTKFGTIKTLILFTFATALSTVTPTFADEPKPVSQHKDWSVFTYKENDKKTCFAVSQPTDSLPKGVNRSSIFFSITHNQADGTTNAVSISMGYPLRKNTTPTVTIGGTVYDLFAQGETVWPTGDQVQARLITAMKRGQKMVLKGVSSRGTHTTDTYSLAGVTAAILGAKKHCAL